MTNIFKDIEAYSNFSCTYLENNVHARHIFKQLCKQAVTSGIVLFIGAGANGTAVPQWDKLVNEMIAKTWGTLLLLGANKKERTQYNDFFEEYDFYARASIVKYMHGSHFNELVGNIIYKNYSQKTLKNVIQKYFTENTDNNMQRLSDIETEYERKNEFGKDDISKYSYLLAIASLCGSCPQIKAIVTYNYDNILEQSINLLNNHNQKIFKRKAVSVGIEGGAHGRRDVIADQVINVYHVHGYLDAPGSLIHQRSNSLVLANDDYNRAFHEAVGWETSSTLHLLRNYSCLFLGTALKDWNMIRLLQAARDNEAVDRHYSIELAPETLSVRKIRSSFLHSLGVNLLTASTKKNDFSSVRYCVDDFKQCLLSSIINKEK